MKFIGYLPELNTIKGVKLFNTPQGSSWFPSLVTGAILGFMTLLSGCGGGGASGGMTGSSTVTTPTLSVVLTDASGATINSVPSGGSATVTATLRDSSGLPAANAVVLFAVDATYGTFTPTTGTALTDALGKASVTLKADSLNSGATAIKASSQVGTATVTGSVNFQVGVSNLTLSALTFGVTTLSAYGTTSVNVTATSNGAPYTTPMTVTFSSPCASAGKAILTASATTLNGTATVSYRDNGCAGTDIVTATLMTGASTSGTLTVSAPALGSLQYVSALPTTITLKGTGGLGMQETSILTFKLVDTGGNPLPGKTVYFSLNTTVGGITLSAPSSISGADGTVVVTVSAGTAPTPVRVTASTVSPALTTQSDQLTITSGIPSQAGFSLSASVWNIEGWRYDGETTSINARLADHFGNPVPAGTAVTFISEGGSVQGSCTTNATGACSVTMTSQNFRPTDGRVTVLAYAVGEEGFVNNDANYLFSSNTEWNSTTWREFPFLSANLAGNDLPEAYIDFNENGVRDATETYLDFNASAGNGAYDGPNGKYDGILCDTSIPGLLCNTQTVHVRGSQIIIFSDSFALNSKSIPAFDMISPASLDFGTECGSTLSVTLTIKDKNNNPLPAGTTVAVTADNGTITSGASFSIEDSIKAGGTKYTIGIKDDGTVDATTLVCKDTTSSGRLYVKITTPNGNITEDSIPVIN